MKLNFISDVHIKEQHDEHAKLLLKFLDQSLSDDIAEIFLVGDIFDLLVGDHREYSERYHLIFSAIKKLIHQGKTIWYFEGNHDLHLSKFFEEEFGEYFADKFILVKEFVELNRFDKSLYITHGDYLTDHEPGYMRYRRFASTKPLEILFERFIPYWFIEGVGSFFSKNSKKTSKKKFDPTFAIEGFRRGAQKIIDYHPVDYLIAGHSHIKDEYQINEKSLYLNNGFAPRENTYLQIHPGGHEFIKL